MAKVSKKQLGRRRRCAALVLLLLIALLIYGITRCVRTGASNQIEADVPLPASTDTTASGSDTGRNHLGVLYSGSFPALETTADDPTDEMPMPTEPEQLPVRQCELAVTPVLQNPELPTGCEVTALTMALQYAGYTIDKCALVDKYLVLADPYTATFGEAFIGSPYDATAWGCYAPVIVETARSFLADQGSTEHVKNLTGCSLKTLLGEVANGTPIVTWATIGMTTHVEERYYWTTDEGKDAVFLINEHCVLLTGYDLDRNIVIVCDPLEGRIEYDLDRFAECYSLVYQQAVAIYETTAATGTAAE